MKRSIGCNLVAVVALLQSVVVTTGWVVTPSVPGSPVPTRRRVALSHNHNHNHHNHHNHVPLPDPDTRIQEAASDDDEGHGNHLGAVVVGRRTWLSHQALVVTAAATATATVVVPPPPPAHALIKGNAPPSTKKPVSDRPKCRNIEECQALAEQAEAERAAEAAANQVDAQVTASGVRYRDEQDGNGVEAKVGDTVELCFKVLKLGKRSYDGLSGEGTVVFSRGFGLENDEDQPGDKTFITTLGALSNVVALNDAVPGMKEGGLRRFAVLPQQGWRKPGQQCDGGPGGSGTGGDLRTDYVVVPTATMVAEEACFDTFKQPFPTTFAQQRRMAQRFDQSLIMEVQLVKILPPSEGGF